MSGGQAQRGAFPGVPGVVCAIGSGPLTAEDRAAAALFAAYLRLRKLREAVQKHILLGAETVPAHQVADLIGAVDQFTAIYEGRA